MLNSPISNGAGLFFSGQSIPHSTFFKLGIENKSSSSWYFLCYRQELLKL